MSNSTVVRGGFWIDHSQKTWGERYLLTLSDMYGDILSNALAVFITSIVAASSWSILAFLFHQLGNHGIPRDCQRRMIEVLLRNCSNVNVLLIGIAVAWKTRPYVPIRSTLISILVILLALAHYG